MISMQSRNKIYWILAMLSVTSYTWIAFQLFFPHVHEKGLTLCLIKNVTGFPCPSCGISRSLLILITGDIFQAFIINPLGLVAAVALLLIPMWILTDVLTAKCSLAEFFLRAENKLKTQKAFYIPGIAFILVNWGWNVIKEL